MTGSLTLLRRLVEMQQFDALHEACYSLPVISSAEQVLLALAQAALRVLNGEEQAKEY